METRSEELDAYRSDLREFAGQAPAIQEFLGYVESAEESDALDRKTKELMSLAISVVLRCEPCILWHTDGALAAGASSDEIDDALQIAVVMGGGPAVMYATEARRIRRDLSE